MKKLNNKGFTLIEIILSFAFIMVICIGLFVTANNYKSKQQLESSKRDLQTYKATLITDIQKDITEKGLKEINECVSISNCYEISFYDNTQKVVQKDSSSKIIIYGGIKYPVKEETLTTIGTLSLIQSEQDVTTIKYDSTGKGVIYKLSIPIIHQEVTDNYDIVIIATAFKSS